MIRVLIAEDEPPTMRRLIRLIEQTDPEFTVVATAPDGEKALEEVGRTPCDVVFTDIRMPVMDGLRLMDELHARYPDCIVVAVSGHQDFAYVAHAVRAQIMDYILKPVSQEDMTELLARVKETYAKRQRAKLSRHLSRHLNRPSMDALPGAPAEAAAKLAVCLFCAGTVPADEDAEMYPGAAAWNRVSPEACLAAIYPERQGFVWEFMGNTPVERILIFEFNGDSADELAQALHAEIASWAGLPVSCASVSGGTTLQGTGQAIRALRRRLRSSTRIGWGGFFCVEEGEREEAAMPEAMQEDVAALARLIRKGQLNAESSAWQALLGRFETEEWTQRQVAGLFAQALAALGERAELLQQVRQLRAVCMEVLYTALSLAELTEGLSGLDALAGGLNDSNSEEQNGIAQRVEQYMREHYQEHLNNQTLAAAFGYVPSYISILFRKAYGISPSEYLTKIRLAEAKRLMEREPHMLIREVAERVGFKSQHHFSRIFKKNEGVWPTGYQP